MILLKELSNNETNYPTVTLELDYTAVCDIHNILCEAEKEKSCYEELSLKFTNIFEMLKHGFITDFEIYKNAKYFKEHDSFANWEVTYDESKSSGNN